MDGWHENFHDSARNTPIHPSDLHNPYSPMRAWLDCSKTSKRQDPKMIKLCLLNPPKKKPPRAEFRQTEDSGGLTSEKRSRSPSPAIPSTPPKVDTTFSKIDCKHVQVLHDFPLLLLLPPRPLASPQAAARANPRSILPRFCRQHGRQGPL